MPKRRTVLGFIRIFFTGFVGFTLIDWLEAQAMKSQSKNFYYENKIAESIDNNKHKTNLHLAIKNQDKALIENLIVEGADIQAVDNDGATALHYAASFGDEEIIKLLIDKGANIQATDNDNKTPVDWANKARRTKNTKLLESLLPIITEN